MKHIWFKSIDCNKNETFNGSEARITTVARNYSNSNFGNIILGSARVMFSGTVEACQVYGPIKERRIYTDFEGTMRGTLHRAY